MNDDLYVVLYRVLYRRLLRRGWKVRMPRGSFPATFEVDMVVA